MGILCGILFLDTLETTWWDRWVIHPIAGTLAVAIPSLFVVYYMLSNFPPQPLGEYLFPAGYEDMPCCWQAFQCSGIDADSYEAMYCSLADDGVKQLLYSEVGDDRLKTCAQMATAVTDYFS
jgi:hypothetical protein